MRYSAMKTHKPLCEDLSELMLLTTHLVPPYFAQKLPVAKTTLTTLSNDLMSLINGAAAADAALENRYAI